MAVLVVVFFADLFAGGAILNAFAFTSGSTLVRPWAFLTAMLLSPGILSLLFNGFSVWVFGRQLEQQFGRSRYLLLYVLGGLGATVFVALFGGIVASASGAIFGLMGAFVVFARRLGGNMIFIYAIIGINLVLVILLPGAVSWQGALGGLVVGAVTALTYYFEGSAAKARQRRLMLTGISAVLVVLALVKALVA
nr:rhomboid family intramembrane serine protease [Galbitalea soli]